MRKISPKIFIEGKEIDYLEGDYSYPGNFSASSITFNIPLTQGGMQKLWNKEVTLFLDSSDSYPIFRGWIKRMNETFTTMEIFAQDAIGYMVKSGGSSKAEVAFNNKDNLDGYTAGAFTQKIIEKAKLDDKIKTIYIGDTSPRVNSVSEPFRGIVSVKSSIEEMVSKAIDISGNLPRPNLLRVIDDGTYSQLIIELESDTDTDPIAHTFTEKDNISSLNIINKKIPTVITVEGKDGVSSTFTHTSGLEAFDRNYLKVSNDKLKSPAECHDFAAKLWRTNERLQFEYSLEVTEGAYLNENDVIRIITEEPEFSGNYRVVGKSLSFSPADFSLSLLINRKPPTLAEYISSRDN